MAVSASDYVTGVIEDHVGRGRFQHVYILALCLAHGIVSIHTYSNMFASGQPAWHEVCPGVDGVPPPSTGALSSAAPLTSPGNCSVPLERWRADVPGASIVGDFKLVCERADRLPMLGSLYFLGYAVGVVICGNVSDHYGRRWAFHLGMLILAIGGFLAPLAPNWSVYALARLLVGAGVAASGLSSYVWAMEFLDKSMRGVMAWLPSVAFSFAQMMASPIAYQFPMWRRCLLACHLASLVGLLYSRCLRESPRWLASAGRVEEAYGVLCAMSRANGREPPPPPPSVGESTDDLRSEGGSAAPVPDDAAGATRTGLAGLAELWDPRLRFRLAVMSLNWFSVAMAFYGVSLFSPNLPMNIYAANVFSALVTVPFCVAAPVLVDAPWCGRRGAMVGSCLAGGVLLLVSTRCRSTGLSMFVYYIANGAVSLAFAVLWIWAAELFPTDVRTRCMSVQSVLARGGCVLSPFVVDFGQRHPSLALCCFAVPCLLSGALDLLLPETRGVVLPATVDDLGGQCRARDERGIALARVADTVKDASASCGGDALRTSTAAVALVATDSSPAAP